MNIQPSINEGKQCVERLAPLQQSEFWIGFLFRIAEIKLLGIEERLMSKIVDLKGMSPKRISQVYLNILDRLNSHNKWDSDIDEIIGCMAHCPIDSSNQDTTPVHAITFMHGYSIYSKPNDI